MKQHFKPDAVADWTERDLQDLVGKYVVVEVEASEWYRENVGGEWEGGTGLCEDAGRKQVVDRHNRDIDISYVHWDYGMGWSWRPDQEVNIFTCDEHGRHDPTDKKAQACLRTLGARGTKKGEDGGEEESSRTDQ